MTKEASITCDPVADAPSTPAIALRDRLSTGEQRWVVRRCSRRGHILAHVDDPISDQLTAVGPDGPLVRCLRCATFVDPEVTGLIDRQVGSPQAPVALAEVPHVLRGSHGRKFAVLRVLATERAGRGLILMAAAGGIAQLAGSHVAVGEWLGRLGRAAQPLADVLGWQLLHSHLLDRTQSLLGLPAATYTAVAWALAVYGGLQLVEAVGLWGGWRWAEYLAVIATSVFVPLEIYEIVQHVTIFKVSALTINLLAVGYLVHKGRLFGYRGGHRAYLAEVRDATFLAGRLRDSGRSTTTLTSRRLA